MNTSKPKLLWAIPITGTIVSLTVVSWLINYLKYGCFVTRFSANTVDGGEVLVLAIGAIVTGGTVVFAWLMKHFGHKRDENGCDRPH